MTVWYGEGGPGGGGGHVLARDRIRSLEIDR